MDYYGLFKGMMKGMKQIGMLVLLAIVSMVYASGINCEILLREGCAPLGSECNLNVTVNGIMNTKGIVTFEGEFLEKCVPGSPGNTICLRNSKTNHCTYACAVYVVEDGITNWLTEIGVSKEITEDSIPENSEECE